MSRDQRLVRSDPSGAPPRGRHRAPPSPSRARRPLRRGYAGLLAVVGALVTAGAAGALPVPTGERPDQRPTATRGGPTVEQAGARDPGVTREPGVAADPGGAGSTAGPHPAGRGATGRRPAGHASTDHPAGDPAPAAADPVEQVRPRRAGLPPDGAGERWRSALEDLDALRAAAFARGDLGLLDRVWAPGRRSRQDTARLRALVGSGCVARGVRHRFDRIELVSVRGRSVRLRVVQSLSRSERVRSGRVVGSFAGTTPAAVTVELWATDTGWRLR